MEYGSSKNGREIYETAPISPHMGLFLLFRRHGFTFNHPGGFNTAKELDFIKQKVNAGDEPWKSAFEKLRSNNWGGMNYSHKAYSEVKCGSHNNPNVGCNNMVYDGMAAYNQALQWYITGDKKHADKSIKILNDWASTWKKNTDFNDKLVASWATPWYVNAAEIIRFTAAGWSAGDIEKFKSFVERLYPYTTAGGFSNNALQSQFEGQIAVGIFLDDKTIFDNAISEWKTYTRTYIYMKKDGATPNVGRKKDMNDAWNRATIFVEGMAQETCRDYGHSVLGIRSIIGTATMAYTQGVDLFEFEKDRIAANVELTGSWLLKERAIPKEICQGTGIDCTGGSSGGKMPNCGKRGWEVAYRHLHDRLGIDMPMAARMIKDVKVEDMARWNNKPETLTAHGVPFPEGSILSISAAQNHAERIRHVRSLPNGTSEISYTLASQKPVNAAVYNMDGKLMDRIPMGERIMGAHKEIFSTSALRPGMYLLKLELGTNSTTRLLTVMTF